MVANVIGRLQEVGLSLQEATVFAALQTHRLATGSELATIANLTRPQTYRILESLANRGFVRATVERPARFEAVRVADLVESLKASTLAKVQEMLDATIALRVTLSALEPPGASTAAGQRHSVVRGREDIMATFAQGIEGATKSIKMVNLHPRGPELMQSFGNAQRLMDRCRNGVAVRLIFAKGALSPEHARDLEGGGIQVRVWTGPELFGSTVLDGEALILLKPDLSRNRAGHDAAALWTDSPGVVSMQSLFFDMAWERSGEVSQSHSLPERPERPMESPLSSGLDKQQ